MDNIIKFEPEAMEILTRELAALGMRIGFSERAGYFVTDAESSETMMVIQSPQRFLNLVRKFNDNQSVRQAADILADTGHTTETDSFALQPVAK